jgi:glycerol-3-phosphate dehydrogenase
MADLRTANFSWQSRQASLEKFVSSSAGSHEYDLLVIGGGITGAGVARDAATRGLKVALVERGDFASGTSSRSSKLIHGGVRYLENFEFHLVFEALRERSHLLKTNRSVVRPLKFFFPVYRGDRLGMFKLSLGLWLYDLLALFRSPGMHRIFFRRGLLKQIPFLRQKDLKGGFSYYDASMWDDVMAVEVLRSAHDLGADLVNYVEAVEPLRVDSSPSAPVVGFRVRDHLASQEQGTQKEYKVRAKKVIVCAGPWTDEVCQSLSPSWKNWLAPSKGVHIIFDLKRIPISGAMVMSQPGDGRIAFVIPRPDYGAGVVIVGTTDGPSPRDPARAEIDAEDVSYLMGLLNRYFPDLKLNTSDILSGYVGVRPLMGATAGDANSTALQKVSREHHIGNGPGGTVVVAGGKYTTFRKMAEEIVDFAIKKDSRFLAGKTTTLLPFNPKTTPDAVERAQLKAKTDGLKVPTELWERYGADAFLILEIAKQHPAGETTPRDPDGFPMLGAQLRYSIRHEMCVHLSDFYFRRLPLYAARADHGLPWAEYLGQVWADEMKRPVSAIAPELAELHAQVEQHSNWLKNLTS